GLQPVQGGVLLLAQGGVLQGFQRSQAAARGLALLAHLGQLGLLLPLLLLQRGQGGLALFQLAGQAIEAGLLLVVLAAHLFQRRHDGVGIQAAALVGQRLAPAAGFQRLLFQVFDLGALDLRPARGLGLGAGVGVPALLPVLQRGLGGAQRFLAGGVLGLQLGQARLVGGDGIVQFGQLALVAADVLADLGEGGVGLGAGLLQALAQFLLVLDLLLDAGQLATDAVDLGLGLAQGLGSGDVAGAAFLDL